MNLILLFPEDFIGADRVRLTGRRFKHVLEVHRAQSGQELCVGLVNDRVGTGTVRRLDATVLEMEVHLDTAAPSPLPAVLVLALPRPKVLKRVLRSVSVLGVKRIVLLNAFRVEKSYWASPVLGADAIREQLVIGLEQARDTVLPEVLLRPLFKPFVEDELPALTRGTVALAAHPGASTNCPRAVDGPLLLVAGPEGGFIQYELDKLQAAGCTLVSIGERILNVEIAVPVLLSRLL